MSDHHNQHDQNVPEYRDQDFWGKLRKYAAIIGCPLLCNVLKLYYASLNPQTPAWAKTVIYGAIAYFIMPIDAIADFIPGLGYSDDFGAVAAAIATVATYIDDDVKEKAARQAHKMVRGCTC